MSGLSKAEMIARKMLLRKAEDYERDRKKREYYKQREELKQSEEYKKDEIRRQCLKDYNSEMSALDQKRLKLMKNLKSELFKILIEDLGAKENKIISSANAKWIIDAYRELIDILRNNSYNLPHNGCNKYNLCDSLWGDLIYVHPIFALFSPIENVNRIGVAFSKLNETQQKQAKFIIDKSFNAFPTTKAGSSTAFTFRNVEAIEFDESQITPIKPNSQTYMNDANRYVMKKNYIKTLNDIKSAKIQAAIKLKNETFNLIIQDLANLAIDCSLEEIKKVLKYYKTNIEALIKISNEDYMKNLNFYEDFKDDLLAFDYRIEEVISGTNPTPQASL